MGIALRESAADGSVSAQMAAAMLKAINKLGASRFI
jgi:hypothetical protein